MKILSIHLRGVGPLRNVDFDLRDPWNCEAHGRVLLTGPNGAGKSTVLRAVAHLWGMVGQWLATPEVKPKGRSESRAWLRNHAGAVAVVATEAPGSSGPVGIYFGPGSGLDELRAKATHWMGEIDDGRKALGRPALIHRPEDEWISSWSASYNRLRLSDSSAENGSATPNLIYLDGEERRWVSPKGVPGQVVPDDPSLRWLVKYRPSENWNGQLESSLVAMKTLDEHGYGRVLRDLNRFLVGKQIRLQPTPHLRLLVDVGEGAEPSATTHTLDDLSSGERQVLIQLYLISRWLQPGGIVFLDEPDLHLHPSLVPLLLRHVEAVVAERRGQLFITSHVPEVWRRYENAAIRIRLGGDL